MCTLRARDRLEFACTQVSRVSICLGKCQLPGVNMHRHLVVWGIQYVVVSPDSKEYEVLLCIG